MAGPLFETIVYREWAHHLLHQQRLSPHGCACLSSLLHVTPLLSYQSSWDHLQVNCFHEILISWPTYGGTQSEQLVCHDKCPLSFRLIKNLCQSLCVFPETLLEPCCFLLATFFILQKCRGKLLWVWLKDSSCYPYLSSGTIYLLPVLGFSPSTQVPLPLPHTSSYLPQFLPISLPLC